MVEESVHKPEEAKQFVGTKIALINKGNVLVILRDGPPNKIFPNMWDLPGGAREQGENPIQTVTREVQEELGLKISPEEIIWQRVYPAVVDPTKEAYFTVVNVTDEQLRSIVFGDEGREWKMMPFDEFIDHKSAVPGMQVRLRDYLSQGKK